MSWYVYVYIGGMAMIYTILITHKILPGERSWLWLLTGGTFAAVLWPGVLILAVYKVWRKRHG